MGKMQRNKTLFLLPTLFVSYLSGQGRSRKTAARRGAGTLPD
jgi:hypothetical protein